MLPTRLIGDSITRRPVISTRFTATLRDQLTEGRKTDAAIGVNLKELGYGG